MLALTLLVLAKLSPLLALLVLLLGGSCVWLQRRCARLEHEASHDPLTGLLNRRGLESRWARAAGNHALLFIDLDGFKAVNDSHGHAVGDALLKQVAARLAAAVPKPGSLARWGGDEFVALVPADRLEAQQAALANAAHQAYDLAAAGGPATVRIGVSTGASVGDAELASAVATAGERLRQLRASRPG